MDNDATLVRYAEMGLAQAAAGAHVLGLSGMMDGQVGVVRAALDDDRQTDTALLAYTAKYASAFYGPFREAVESTLQGDRRTYQQDPANLDEALRELALDVAEGADIVMVKPALPYLDVLRRVADEAAHLGRAGRRLPGVRRAGDGRGGLRAGLAGPRADHPRDADLDPSGRRRDRADLLGGRGGRPAATGGLRDRHRTARRPRRRPCWPARWP